MFSIFATRMKTLHIFNPEHDIALAANLKNFTAPHAGRRLRSDMGYLPALWAHEDDAILVGDKEYASRAFNQVNSRCHLHLTAPQWVDRNMLAHESFDRIEPWGWDKALCHQLHHDGVEVNLLPDDIHLDEIRLLSHRRTSAALLPFLQTEWTVGEAFECRTLQEVDELQYQYGQIVVKAPWSSSGRGVQFALQEGWLLNTIHRQGSVLVEPFFHKVKDFAMEFEADGCGGIRYVGLSLFHTKNGFYIGNLLATEDSKRQIMSQYIPVAWLDIICGKIVNHLKLGSYQGPFGIDMMVVKKDERLLLHPCVEINLRRTMGHVALQLSSHNEDVFRVMRIELKEHYKIRIRKINSFCS
jgi:hypothetical protein